MGSVTKSARQKTERRQPGWRIAGLRSLEQPLHALGAAGRAVPLLYVELGGLDSLRGSNNRTTRAACKRAVASALQACVGSALRKKDIVAAGPSARWFVALLLDRSVASRRRDTLIDADMGVAAARIRAAVQSALDRLRRDGILHSVVNVRTGWTLLEAAGNRPLDALRHSVRGAAVVARIEERRAVVLAAVTHELRTPLTSIVGYVERLRDESTLDGAQRWRYLSIVADEAHRLHRLVEGLIDAGSWNAGGLSLRYETVSMRELAQTAWLSVAERARSRGINISVRGDASLSADRERLLQVLINLFDNAVRHAKTDGGVRASIDDARDSSTLTIEDDGAGFDPKVKRKLGQPFVLGPNGRVGLGLSIARAIVDAHGGKMSAGGSKGGGGRISVRLPKHCR